MSATEHLRGKYSYLWDRLFHHPFVVGIGNGELPLEKFQFYVKQDYYFLVQYSRMLALATAKLESTRPAPITLAYTDYLLRVAYEGTLTDVVANLLPCQWGYSETGQHLARTGDTSDANPYAEWIQMYSAEEFTSFVDWLREFLDSLTEEAGSREMSRLEEHFLTATRYEFLFWEMSYNLQDWPL